MPYHIGSKGSNGCSGFPVLSDAGKVVGCHPSKSEATNHLQALYANVPDATKGEASIETSMTPENPSASINPNAGMKKPQYGLKQPRPTGSGIHNKPGIDIWNGSFFGKADTNMENEILPTSTYQGCSCETCQEMNVACKDCPVCQSGEMKSNCCGDVVKQDPCWDGYVQRGMKEQNGKMVPNCIPVTKSDDEPKEEVRQESFFNFRDLRPVRNTIRIEE